MATFTIQFSVADEHMERIRYALRKHFGPVYDQVTENVTDPETGLVSTVVNSVPRDMNSTELLKKVRQMSIDNIKAIVMSVEANEAAQKARDAVTAVTVE